MKEKIRQLVEYGVNEAIRHEAIKNLNRMNAWLSEDEKKIRIQNGDRAISDAILKTTSRIYDLIVSTKGREE